MTLAQRYNRLVSLRRRALLTILCSLFCLPWTTACSSSHSVAIPNPDTRVADYCAALHAKLPDKVGEMSRQDPKPPSDLTAGWGQSIILRCGVPQPAEDASSNADGLQMDGVSWSFARMSDGSARVTTTLRKAYVEVTLKGKYAYDSSPLFDLAPAIKSTIPAGI